MSVEHPRKLRIAHVATLVSPDGAYGGPIRVALNQLAALQRHGHEVVLFAGQRGYETEIHQIAGVPVQLFPVKNVVPKAGFAGLVSPALQASLRRQLSDFDVVHVHLARDLVTLPAARLVSRSGVRLVTQTHGMIDKSTNPLSVPLDAVLTRPVLRGASTVFYLTDREQSDLRSVAGHGLALQSLPNGVPDGGPQIDERGEGVEVLFLARLQARKRPLAFVHAASTLTAKHPSATFTLVGPDEGEGAAVRSFLAGMEGGSAVSWEGAISPNHTLDRMRKAAIFVLPSVDEPFPMSVLEAMSVGLPVIVTDSCGLAPDILEADAGLVVDASQPALVAAIDRLLSDERLRAKLGRNAAAVARSRFSMPAIVRRLESAYESDAQHQL